jgi:hypothetical protein
MLHLSQDGQESMVLGAQPLIRLYRGQPAASVYNELPAWIRESVTFQQMLAATGRWFTANLDEAAWYARECDDGEIVFIDLPADEVERYRVSNIALKPGGKDAMDNPRAFSRRPELEFFIPQELVLQTQVFTFSGENLDEEGFNSFKFR